ncbi:MAG: phosphoglycerate kinase, partial [Pseudomonadota bacterium]
MNAQTLDDLQVRPGLRVLVRVDINVPMENGRVTDLTRIERIKPTVAHLASKGAKVVLLAHFGRPKGKSVAAMSLSAVVPALAEVFGQSVGFCGDCIGADAEAAVMTLGDGDILLLENTRFHPGEETNDPAPAAPWRRQGLDHSSLRRGE